MKSSGALLQRKRIGGEGSVSARRDWRSSLPVSVSREQKQQRNGNIDSFLHPVNFPKSFAEFFFLLLSGEICLQITV